MSFVLSGQRGGSAADIEDCFRRYREYLQSNATRFPPAAYMLAMSDSHFELSGDRSPHDGWLHELRMIERREDVEDRAIDIYLRLLHSSHGHFLEFYYRNVTSYTLEMESEDGHRDWRYDEFRLTDDGKVKHEIEWFGAREVGHWLIVASDIQLRHIPLSDSPVK